MSIGRQGFVSNQRSGAVVPAIPPIPANVFARWWAANPNNIHDGVTYSHIEDTQGVNHIKAAPNQLLFDNIYGVDGWLGAGGVGRLTNQIVDNQSPTFTSLVWVTNPAFWVQNVGQRTVLSLLGESLQVSVNIGGIALPVDQVGNLLIISMGSSLSVNTAVINPNQVDNHILVATTFNKTSNGSALTATNIRIMRTDGTIFTAPLVTPFVVSYSNPIIPFAPINQIGFGVDGLTPTYAGDPINPAIINELAFADGVAFTDQDFIDYYAATRGLYGL